jgi:hypothetical protein
MLDGEEVGRLKHGEMLAASTAPGRHRLYLAIDWCRSRYLDVDLAAGEVVHVFCWPSGNAFTAIFYGTVGRARAIGLQVLNASTKTGRI